MGGGRRGGDPRGGNRLSCFKQNGHELVGVEVSTRDSHARLYARIRQHTSAYVSIRQHASAYVSIREHT